MGKDQRAGCYNLQYIIWVLLFSKRRLAEGKAGLDLRISKYLNRLFLFQLLQLPFQGHKKSHAGGFCSRSAAAQRSRVSSTFFGHCEIAGDDTVTPDAKARSKLSLSCLCSRSSLGLLRLATAVAHQLPVGPTTVAAGPRQQTTGCQPAAKPPPGGSFGGVNSRVFIRSGLYSCSLVPGKPLSCPILLSAGKSSL